MGSFDSSSTYVQSETTVIIGWFQLDDQNGSIVKNKWIS